MINPKYHLICTGCGRRSVDAGYEIFCPSCGRDALLQSVYAGPLSLRGDVDRFASYQDWLPSDAMIPGVGEGPRMATLHTPELGAAIGVPDLWVAASAYAPELGAEFCTASFKETEALGVLARVREQTRKKLIISSAGNAARAFLEYGARAKIPLVVVAPQAAAPVLVTATQAGDVAPLLVLLDQAMYVDAIRFVDAAVAEFSCDLVREGGAFNVARRDAMAVPFLRAVQAMGGMPDVYVQAVGSGTGALAAAEAAARLTHSGMYPPHEMRLLLVQNAPFTPMVDAWASRSRHVISLDDQEVRARLSQVAASVLSNPSPPYAVRGGIYDVLQTSHGSMMAVTNEEIHAAQTLAEQTLGFRPCHASAAALAGLHRAARMHHLPPGQRILLHLTGGGLERLMAEGKATPYCNKITVDRCDTAAGLAAIARYLQPFTTEPNI